MIVDDLKKSLLMQAFQGNLSVTDSADTDVEVSYKRIAQQKEKLIENYKVRNEPIYKDLSEKEKIFNIPLTWKWYRIGELGVFKKGPFGSSLTKSMFIKDCEDAIKVYEQKNAIQKDINIGDYYISKKYFEEKMKSFEVNSGDIIVSCAGTIGETYVIPKIFRKGIINQALMKMTMVKEININYFLLYFDFILKKESNNLSSGSAIKNIPPFDIFKQLPIPLPPIEEQQRIVDKIEELFAKLDEIKLIEEELTHTKDNFPAEMKKSILYEAFCGKLVKNDENNNSIELINEIIKTKERKIRDGIIKEEKYLNPKEEEYPYKIPKNWNWVRLGCYCEKITDQVASGSFKAIRDNVPSLKTEDYALMVKTADFSNGFSKNLTYTTEHAYHFLQNSNLYGGELIMSNIGSIGKIFIVPNLNIKMTLAPNTVMLRFTDIKLRDYIYYFFQSPQGFSQLMAISSGTTMKKFNKTDLKKILVPIPPIDEQKRIVDKIEKLLPLCDDIDKIVGEK